MPTRSALFFELAAIRGFDVPEHMRGYAYAYTHRKKNYTRFDRCKQGDPVIAYLIFIVTSTFVGAVAVLLCRRKNTLDPKVFLATALANAGALAALLLYQKRRQR